MIRKIEALIEKGATEGERQAANLAKERLEKIRQSEEIEYTIRLPGVWHERL